MGAFTKAQGASQQRRQEDCKRWEGGRVERNVCLLKVTQATFSGSLEMMLGEGMLGDMGRVGEEKRVMNMTISYCVHV